MFERRMRRGKRQKEEKKLKIFALFFDGREG